MTGSTFKTNPYYLHELLQDCHQGHLQLPDFQRSWVWDEDRILSLIASVSRAFPIGALMSLETGGEVDFKPRPIEGAPDSAKSETPQALLLDGQQRITSLYQASLGGRAVDTVTPKKKRVKRWFYIDILKALDETANREEAIVALPENKIIAEDFGRKIVLDLSMPENEFENLMYPIRSVFNWNDWQTKCINYYIGKYSFQDKWDIINKFQERVIRNFEKYQIPVITLDSNTSKEAVCVVFEKVNTGGKPLDAFELVTAMYAADGYELRKDWYGKNGTPGRHHRFVETFRLSGQDKGILADVANTDFLQAVSLFHTRDRRRKAEAEGKIGRELPQVTANRAALLDLPLGAYLEYQEQVEQGFVRAAKFLHMLHIYRVFDLPYQSQMVPLAAILADIGSKWENDSVRTRLVRWYWNGVFGELYGSAVETRIARDFMEVPPWLDGGETPSTIRDASFRADRLNTMRTRISAAYKGVNALLMNEGAQDFLSGQKFDHTVFFGENVDIHHIFPRKWCDDRNFDADAYNSIINKTPLTYRTNRIIGGVAPSAYLAKLESGRDDVAPIPAATLDRFLQTHLIDSDLLRNDDFKSFMDDRQARLLGLIEGAMGQPAHRGSDHEEGENVEGDEDADEARHTVAVPAE